MKSVGHLSGFFAFMGFITKPKTYSDNDPILYTDLNANWDTLYNLLNGNLDNSNLASGAAIDPLKISGGAVTLLTPQTIAGQKTLTAPILNQPLINQWDGWQSVTVTLTYSSTDGHTFVVGTSVDLTTYIGLGDRVKFTNNAATFFGIVTAITSSTMTLYGGTQYTVTSSAITNFYYSHLKNPVGFLTRPDYWTETLRDTSRQTTNTPTAGTWYNTGSLSLAIPIGLWRVEYQIALYFNDAANAGVQYVTLSTANSSASDQEFVAVLGAIANQHGIGTLYRSKILPLTVKTIYYVNTQTDAVSASAINLMNDNSTLMVNAICAYL